MSNARIQKLLAKPLYADLVFITSLPNLKYFFNYSGESYERFCCGLLSPRTEKTALIVPKLDEGKTKNSYANSTHLWSDGEGYEIALKEALSEIKTTSANVVGCEDITAYWQTEALGRSLGSPKFVSVSPHLIEMRSVKDQKEIESIRRSGKILSKAYKEGAGGILRAGLTEREAAFELRKVLSEAGAASVDFCAVQSGPNGAIPHLETTGRTIEHGDAIVVDISIRTDEGYFSDFTRTFVAGHKPSRELVKVHGIVQKAQRKAIDSIKEGVTPNDVDSAARKEIDKSGLGEFFYHRTGHGIGLEVHEPPWIKQGNRSKLCRGMAFTIEPGIYLEGKFGVRIEDDLVINLDGKVIDMPDLTPDLIEV